MVPQRTTRPLVIACVAIGLLMFLALARATTSPPLAIRAGVIALLGPLLLPFAHGSWTPQNVKFALFSIALPALAAAAYLLRPNAITVALAVLGFFVWCLCGFAIVTAGY